MTDAAAGNDQALRMQQQVEDLLEQFDTAWQEGPRPKIERFLPSPDGSHESIDAAHRRKLLEELIKIDLECRWRRRDKPKGKGTIKKGTTVRGPDQPQAAKPRLPDRPHLEDYLRRFPELGSLDDLPLELVVEEYRVRQRWGDRPTHDVYPARFPRYAADLPPRLVEVDADLSRSPAKETTIARSDVMLAEDSTAKVPASRKSDAVPPLPARIGRYSIRAPLGQGAFGVVYLGHDEELQRPVAIKVPLRERVRKQRDMQAIFREARLAAQLRHPALVEVYDVGREENGRCYIVMEYIEGQSLHAIMRAQRVPPQQAIRWVLRIAEAVHCAHKVGLVHADLKPGNILIDKQGEPHVADFGLAISDDDQRQRAKHVAGTPAYMAPEQVRGESHRLDGRTDLWSLGAILYELLTGRMPFGGDTVDQIFDEIQHRDPKPPRQIDDTITPELEWVCLKCLSKQVTQRYTTAMDLARDLQQALESAAQASPRGAPRPAAVDAGYGALVGRTRSNRLPDRGQARSAPQTNLSTAATSFIGREHELVELAALLADPAVWLVTLIGPGGIGKTRTAQRLGQELLPQFPGGCWFAELEEARTAPGIAHAVAQAFGVPLTGSEPPEQVVANVLEYRRPLLLILDNFEQAVAHAQATVGLWRQRAPHVRFLATSRSPLGLSGERHFELGPLAAPALTGAGASAASRPSEVAAFDSVKLFRERACEVSPDFVLDDENAQAVAQICRELEGIPLAVELAAARIKVMRPTQMARKLGQKFQLLQSSRRDLAPRQQTLAGAIDWSYSLLSDWEQQAFMQCSIFRGGFSLEAAEAVIDLAAFPRAPLSMDVVQSLREKSLLTRQDTRYEARFGMYLSIREYAEGKWQQTAEVGNHQALNQRFAVWCLGYAEYWDARIHTAEAAEALDRVQTELVNLFAVQDWAASAGQPETAARAVLAVAQTMAVRGPADRRVWRLERALAALPAESKSLRVGLLTTLSEACQAVGAWDRGVTLADEAVALAPELGLNRLHVAALLQQGEMRRHRGNVEGAHACFVQCESICRQLGDLQGVARSLAGRGIVVWQRGDSDQALHCYAEADAIAHDLEDRITAASIARHRGHVLWQRGDYNGALRCYAEAETIARELGDERTIHLTVGNRGIVLADRGDYDGALQCYAEAETIARKLGDKRGIAMNVGNRGISLSDRGDPRGALACYLEAEGINRQMQTKFGIAVNIGNRGNALADLGDFDAALKQLAEAEAMNREMGNKFLFSLNIGDRGSALLRMGRLDEAREALGAALGILDEINTRHSPEYFTFQTLLAQTEQQLGNSIVAAILAHEALTLAETLGLTENHPKLKIRDQLTSLHSMTEAPPSEPTA